ncbi:MAG: zf-HC2 domain-containing protein [Oscillospiraceae bacterium]|nr:zf-HC2 domain-containing protein [Oscillospiraceae bacterium]
MKSCEAWQEQISADIDGELDAAERAALQAHLASCAECRAVYEAFSALSGAWEPEPLPDSLHKKIMERISTARAAETQRRQERFLRLRPLALTAACLVVIVGTLFAAQHGMRVGSGSSNTSSTVSFSMDTAAEMETADGGETENTAAATGADGSSPESATAESADEATDDAAESQLSQLQRTAEEPRSDGTLEITAILPDGCLRAVSLADGASVTLVSADGSALEAQIGALVSVSVASAAEDADGGTLLYVDAIEVLSDADADVG